MDLKICSLNVRGLGDKLKRREIFLLAKEEKLFYFYASRSALLGKHNVFMGCRMGIQNTF